MVKNDDEFAVGDRVLVPWGLDEIPGEVVQLYTTGLGQRAVVRLLGQEGPEQDTVTLPVDSLVRVSEQAEPEERLDVASYERALKEALASMLPRAPIRSQPTFGGDERADYVLEIEGRQFLVEAKARPASKRLTSDDVLAVSGLARHGRPVVLVSNTSLTREAQRRLRDLSAHAIPIFFVQWTGPGDDDQLRLALASAASPKSRPSEPS